MTVVKWSPIFPVPIVAGIGPAVPVRYGGAGTLHGVYMPAAGAANDRRLLLTKNGSLIADLSGRARDEKGFIAWEEPIVANDIFRLQHEAETGASGIIYASLLADIAPNNVYQDYGAHAATDLSFDAGTTFGTAPTSSSIARATAAQLSSSYTDGRQLQFDGAGSGGILYRENTAGRTGTDFYIRFLANAATGTGAVIEPIGVSFLTQSGSAVGYLLSLVWNSAATDSGIFRFSGATITAVAVENFAPVATPHVVEAIKMGSNFFFLRNRSATGFLARDTTTTTAGSLGIYMGATSNTNDLNALFANLLVMMV